MENFKISADGSGLHIEGFPDGVKVISIDGHESKRLADLSLHKADLEFADACLDAVNQVPEKPDVIREALWHSAIVHFFKCFGSDARFRLSPVKLYKSEPAEALIAFNYFKSLRNKHLVHDENSYAQSIPGAISNNGTKTYKIEKIISFLALGSTLDQGNYGNLKSLIQKAKSWVVTEYDVLCNRITTELEKETYESLLSREPLTYNVPTVEEVHHARRTK